MLNGAFAQVVRNAESPYRNIEPCDAYSDFLRSENAVATEERCHPIANFLVGFGDKEWATTRFLREYSEFARGNSALSFMIRAQRELMYRNPREVYFFADLADREIFFRMSAAGDTERAVLYSSLLSRLKLDSVKSICGEAVECDLPGEELRFDDLFGNGFEFMNRLRADMVLGCLLKTDAFLVDIRKLLRSRRFEICVRVFSSSDVK
jgi:hypothetical protein